MKNKKRSNSDILGSMSWKNQHADTSADIRNLFTSNFASVYIIDSRQISTSDLSSDNQRDDLSEFEVSYDSVYKQLLALNPNEGAGLDGLPNYFIKNCAAGLCEPLTHIMSVFLQRSVFPSACKLSYITPIYKAGIKSDTSNYRPICI